MPLALTLTYDYPQHDADNQLFKPQTTVSENLSHICTSVYPLRLVPGINEPTG